MKNKKVKYLAMLLAFSMAVSPMSYTQKMRRPHRRQER